MSDNPKELYIQDNNGNYVLIDPKTQATVVNDKANNNSVQHFIDNGANNWEEANGDKQYVSASFLNEWKNEYINQLNAGFERILNYNNLIYCGEWEIGNGETPDFGSIELPIKKGSLFKVVGETPLFYKNRIYKNDDYIFFNKYIEKDQENWWDTDEINNIIEILRGYGNGDLGINSVIVKAFPTYQDMENYSDTSDLVDETKQFIVIVANDEIHRELLSFYQYCNNIEKYIPEDEMQEVSSYEEMTQIKVFTITPDFNYSLDVDDHFIILNEYIDENENVTAPSYEERTDFKKYVKINGTDGNNYYKWNGYEWVYLGNSNSHWMYLFSHEDDEKIRERVYNLEKQMYNILLSIDEINESMREIESGNNGNVKVIDNISEGNNDNTLYIIRK